MRVGAIAFLTSATLAGGSLAQNWVLVEAHSVPSACEHPVTCIEHAQLILRNMLHMEHRDRQALYQFLNRVAVIRGIPEDTAVDENLELSTIIPLLQTLPAAAKTAALVEHPGVFFDSTSLDADPFTAGFSKHVREQLGLAGVRFLTKEEMEATPGRPTLGIRFTARAESGGCIVPFSVSMSISEESVMVRNPEIKAGGSAWSGSTKENLANLNYTPTNALQEVVKKFVADWKAANPS